MLIFCTHLRGYGISQPATPKGHPGKCEGCYNRLQVARGRQQVAGSVLHSALMSEITKTDQQAAKHFVGWLLERSKPPAARKTPALAPSDAAGTYIPVKVQAAGSVGSGSPWEQLIVRLPSGLPRGAVQLEVARGGYTSPAKVSHAPLAACGA